MHLPDGTVQIIYSNLFELLHVYVSFLKQPNLTLYVLHFSEGT